MSFERIVPVALLLAFAGLPRAQAQVLYGTLLGNVGSVDGQPVSGAKIAAMNPGTGLRREAAADERGAWAFRDLPPGAYDVQVSAAGFTTADFKNVAVRANAIARTDATLTVATQTQAVEVSANQSRVQADSGDLHTELSTQDARNLPLNGYRNYQTLLDLVPGATPSRFQNSVMDTPGRSLTTNINGSSRTSNVTSVDGAAIQQIYLPHHTLYNPPADAIESVNIATNSFSAEQGLAGGAVVTVITKSGSNDFHGTLNENHTNSAFAARNFFYYGQNLPLNLINQFGATLGGPIRKNKLFFFSSYEGVIQRQNYSTIASVPTAAQRSGAFDGLTTVYDPNTGNPDGSGRTPFAGNQVPAERQSAAAQKMLALIPLPNLTGTSSNYFVGANYGLDRHSIDEKGTWQVDARSSFFGKFSYMDAQVSSAATLGAGGGTGLSPGGSNAGSGFSHMKVTVLGSGYTRTIRPNLVFDANFGFGRNVIDWYESDYGKNYGSEVLGIPGTNGADLRSSGLPSFAVSGFETFGNTDAYTPEIKHDNTFTYVANLAWSHGSHNIRFGYQALNNRLDEFQPQRGFGPRGGFTFAGGITALRGGTSPNSSNAMADFLLGQATTLGKSYQYLDPITAIEWQHGIYAQDQWRVNARLTVNYGLRWEYYPIMTRDARGIERYDFTTNRVILGGVAGTPADAGTNPVPHHLAPRFGFAYRATPKTVVRGGYGITVDPYPFTRAMRDPYPVTVAQTISSTSTYLPAGNLVTGIPKIAAIDTTQASIPLPVDAYTKTLYPGDFRRGYIQSFNLTLEQELPGLFTVSAGYVGTRSIRQLAYIEANAGQTPGAGASGQPLYQAFGRSAQTQVIAPDNTANYNALQISAKRRFANGFSLTAAYTWSKSIDFNSDSDSTPLFNMVSARGRNRGPSNFDRAHVFQAAGIYRIPFHKTHNAAWNWIADGWQLNVFFSAYTGTPFTPTASGTSLNAAYNTQVADLVKSDVAYPKGIGPNATWFDTSAFAPVSQARLGTASRNSLRGPGATNVDLGISRSFSYKERLAFELRGEAFNLTNSPIFSNPGGNASNGSFGRITATAGTAADSRVLRVAGRITF